MREFIAIDFETANPKRVSACALGYARVIDGQVVDSNAHLIKPVGGHAAFQSQIHGIKHEHTFGKPDFGQLFPEINELFESTLVAHSLFDRQVLIALSDHFRLGLKFEYFDTSSLAKQRLPELKNHKLKTLAKYFSLPKFQHHDAREDAIACANICLKLHGKEASAAAAASSNTNEDREFKSLIHGILADNEVHYKEAYELLYWLQDHIRAQSQYPTLFSTLEQFLEDDELDRLEANILANMLSTTIQELEESTV